MDEALAIRPADGLFIIAVNREVGTLSMRWWCAGMTHPETLAVLTKAQLQVALPEVFP